MKITLKRTEEQLELIKAMASKNRDVAYQAQVALAEFIGPVLAKVINQAPTLSNLFSNFQFNADESPSIPMDLYYDITDEDYATVWSQAVPGGLPTNTVTPIGGEMKFTTYRLDSAVDFDKRYAQRSRMDVVSKSFTRVAQEILLKQERNSAALIMGALADAKTGGKDHTIVANNVGTSRLILDDFNKLLTLGKRINTVWTGGTPEGGIGGRGVTDLICSPEIVKLLLVLLEAQLLKAQFLLLTRCAMLFIATLVFPSSTEFPSWSFRKWVRVNALIRCSILLTAMLTGLDLPLLLLTPVTKSFWALTVVRSRCFAPLLLIRKLVLSSRCLLMISIASVNPRLDTTDLWKRVA